MYKIYFDNNLIYEYGSPSAVGFDFSLTLELNSAGSLSCCVPMSNINYEKIKAFSLVSVLIDDVVRFRGEVTNISIDIFGNKTFVAQGVLAKLNDTIQAYASIVNDSPSAYLGRVITRHNNLIGDNKFKFVLGNISINSNKNVTYHTPYVSTKEAISSNLLDVYGGYLNVRYEIGSNYIDYVDSINVAYDQCLIFSQNLLDLLIEKNEIDVVTCVIPLGAKKKDSHGNDIEQRYGISGEYVSDSAAVANYGKRFVTLIEDDVTSESTLRAKANEYLNKHKISYKTISAKGIDFAKYGIDLKLLKLGDYVKLIHDMLGVDELVQLTKIVYSSSSPCMPELCFGATISTLSKQTASNSAALSVVSRGNSSAIETTCHSASIGQVVVTSANENPSIKGFDGTWTLVGKDFKTFVGNIDTSEGEITNAVTSGTNFDVTAKMIRSEETIRLRFSITTNIEIGDATLDICSVDFSKLGISNGDFAYGVFNILAASDNANAVVVCDLSSTGRLTTKDVIARSGSTTIPVNSSFGFTTVINVLSSKKDNNACDKFYWKRIS